MPRPKGSRDADYDEKRAALLRRMIRRVMRRETARPSLRQLAEAAEVSVPTLRHYFGGRAEVVSAILEEVLKIGQTHVDRAARPKGSFADSVHDFARTLIYGLRTGGSLVRLSDAMAVSLAEGMLDREIGPATLRYMVDPILDALRARLDAHVARGDMAPGDTRAAALMLMAPILIATLHQDQMGGSETSPLPIEAAVGAICDAFVRAHAAPAAVASAAAAPA